MPESEGKVMVSNRTAGAVPRPNGPISPRASLGRIHHNGSAHGSLGALILIGGLLVGCSGPAAAAPSSTTNVALPSAFQAASESSPATTATDVPPSLSPSPQDQVDQFTATGDMLTARYGHTATLLNDGHVLIAGGVMADGPHPTKILASAELYDPATGLFAATGSMTMPRGFHTATLLQDGRVLIVGGGDTQPDFFDQQIPIEVYDPSSGTFSATGAFTMNADGQTATLLLDGRVLITGGFHFLRNPRGVISESDYERSDAAELYDPATRTIRQTGHMTSGREGHTATLLADGRVLVVGGRMGPLETTTSAELFDPASGTFDRTGNTIVAHSYHTATLLKDGRVLIVGGDDHGDSAYDLTYSSELYVPVDGRFTATPVERTSAGSWVHTAALLPDGRVLIAGGFTRDSTVNLDFFMDTADVYDPASATYAATLGMTQERAYTSATLLQDGQVLIAGGESYHGSLASVELFR